MKDKFSFKNSIDKLLNVTEKDVQSAIARTSTTVDKMVEEKGVIYRVNPIATHGFPGMELKVPVANASVGNDRLTPVDFVNTDLPDIIELKNITQVYENSDGSSTTVLKNLNLLIEDKPNVGQFVSIMGGSGCGKSTLLRYISGLQQPTGGEVLYHGKSMVEGKQRINMVFQQYSSFPWLTVLDNVALGLEYQGVGKAERREKAAEMLKVVGLSGHEYKYAQYPQLSGGQLQRVAIARSLLSNKEILLLDEPFGALDVKTRMDMQDMLMNIWNEIHPTIIMVTHDVAEAVYLSDDICLMAARPGEIVEHLQVKIPYPRVKGMKRTNQFREYVDYLEDRLTEIQSLR
jgi:NitT/TauT family transport system ATP-binding protein